MSSRRGRVRRRRQTHPEGEDRLGQGYADEAEAEHGQEVSPREAALFSGEGARGSSSRPASVKRVAANSIGGTLSTTSFTAVKLVPKKKTVSRSEASTRGEARRSFVTLADEVCPAEPLDVDGDQTRSPRGR